MTINWGALGIVAVVSLVVGVLVVVLVSLALVGLSAHEPAHVSEPAEETLVIGRGGSGLSLSHAAGTVVAAVCLLGAATIVLYGIYLSPSDPSLRLALKAGLCLSATITHNLIGEWEEFRVQIRGVRRVSCIDRGGRVITYLRRAHDRAFLPGGKGRLAYLVHSNRTGIRCSAAEG